MVNMSAKFDKEICNGLVSIVFTRSTHGRTEPRTHGRTEPQQRYYIPTATRCAGIINHTDHVSISRTKPSSVILSKFEKKNDAKIKLKQKGMTCAISSYSMNFAS